MPPLSPLLARALLGITFGTRTVVSLALGFAGVVLVLNPFGERLDGSVFVALTSGFFNAQPFRTAYSRQCLPCLAAQHRKDDQTGCEEPKE